MILVLTMTFSICACTNTSTKSSESKKTDEIQKNETNTKTESSSENSDVFVMNHETRQGFMQNGTAQTEVEEEYTGIYSVDDLLQIQENKKGKYMLMADLDMSGVEWESEEFNGTLDGNYHKITGMSQCLISFLNGNVKNLAMENVNTTKSGLIEAIRNGTIENCYVTGNVDGVAGIVGFVLPDQNVTIEISNCYNAADISTTDYDGKIGTNHVQETGGIAGLVDFSDIANDTVSVSFSNCENYGSLNGMAQTGGIIGEIYKRDDGRGYYHESTLTVTLLKCFNYGTVQGSESVGGILGDISAVNASKTLKNQYIVQQCANYGEVISDENVGGICGLIKLKANKEYNYVLSVNILDCLNTAELMRAKDGEENNVGGGISGSIEMEYGTCSINRYLNIGNQSSEYCSMPTINYSTPSYECNNYYTTKDFSISQMKDIQTYLINFDFPQTWGIDDLYNGFPHPYGDDEYDDIMEYYNQYSQAENTEDTKKETEDYKSVYNNALALDTFKWGTGNCLESSSDSIRFMLIDINDDGTEELLMENGKASHVNGYRALACSDNGEFKFLTFADGFVGYYPKHAVIVTGNLNHGIETTAYYQMENGELRYLFSKETELTDDSTADDLVDYYDGNGLTTEDEYNQLLKETLEDEIMVEIDTSELVENTQENREKYLQ